MEADLQSHVAFYLTGKKRAAALEDIAGLNLKPALFAGFDDLTRMRYDYPLVLVDALEAKRSAEPLSGLIDAILAKVAQGAGAERIRKHVLSLETEIRRRVARGQGGRFSKVWDEAAREMTAADPTLAESFSRARANLTIDGELADCDAALAGRLVSHAWSLTQKRRARRVNEIIDRMIVKLAEILHADFIHSDAGRSAEKLKNSFGAGPLNSFDFDALSSLLKKATRHAGLPASRRKRLQGLIASLQAQKFYPAAQGIAAKKPFAFAFDSCSAALKAYRERQPKAVELARAMAMAELEIRGEYSEARHDPLFKAFGENGLDTAELALFPDYLVHINATELSGAEQGTLTEILSAELPFKILVQTDDIIEESPIANNHLAFALRSRQIATMAMGMNGVFVLQSPTASLCRLHEPLRRGLDFAGPTLFNLYSGASAHTALFPPYLMGAAALEARAFPAFCFDPSAGADWASRFTLAGNPQPEEDWATHELLFQDAACQRVKREEPFTLVDFAACDARYARHFARVPRTAWNDALQKPLIDALAQELSRRQVETVPYLTMATEDGTLQRVIADETMIREARRCKTMWNSLQELAGIHNSHAQNRLAAEKALWESAAAPAAAATVTATPAAAAPTPAPAPVPEPAEAAPAHEDKAYIETPRCASCNECIQINDKMFVYDGNKQAYIADLDAGTYAQLVEAAENCQVAIIHPGKPKNPNEPGLEELLKRAEAFA